MKGPLEMNQAELLELRQLLEQNRRIDGGSKTKAAKKKKAKIDKLLEELSKGMK